MGKITVTEDVIADVSRRVGAVKGSPNYKLEYDVNQDGVIDIVDVAFFSKHFGETVEVPQVSALPILALGLIVLLLIIFWMMRK